jgi:hypothetical protein
MSAGHRLAIAESDNLQYCFDWLSLKMLGVPVITTEWAQEEMENLVRKLQQKEA